MTTLRTPLAIAAGVLLGFAMSAGVARADLHDPLATKGQVLSKPSINADAPAAQDLAVPAATARSAVKGGLQKAGLMKRIENQDTTREQEGESCNHD